ncbi:O-acetyl-ADP-ribose deacetylase [Algoriphagus halophilus]|uniref:O-acetyl-ADP-ribose deacetylase n=1 Tax=Algoriphagus halophilus TaxID=226505 RepID=UPI00358F5B35
MEIELIKGDITQLAVDAIVKAANSSLLGGGGVDGAIHRAGGTEILAECQKIRAQQGGCKVGEAVITTAGNLKANYVIHTVGPVWKGGKSGEAERLKNCYINSLKIASEHGVKSIAFPNISTGVYGYPLEEAAEIAITAVSGANFPEIETLTFVCFNQENYELYDQKLNQMSQ